MSALLLALSALAAPESVALPLDDTLIDDGFEQGLSDSLEITPGLAAIVGEDPTLKNEASLLVDTTASEGEWFVYLRTKTGLLQAGRRYRLRFRYRVLERAEDAHFYLLASSKTEQAKHPWAWKSFISWKEDPGFEGLQNKLIVLPEGYDDFRLEFGVRNAGRMLVDALELWSLESWDFDRIRAEAKPAPGKTPWEPIGMCAHPGMPWVYTSVDEARRAMRMLGEAGCQWVRMGAGWGILEPEEGVLAQNVLDQLDAALDEAERQGMRTYMQVLGTPRWASTRPSDERYWAYPPKDLEPWRAHVRYLAERYKGRVKHWEVWNEMDWEFWEAPLEAFVPLLKATYEELKAVDPEIQVILGGLATDGVHPWDNPKGDQRALQRLFDAGAGPYFDIFSMHPYPYDVTTGAAEALDKINTACAVLDRNGAQDKPVWLTELGVSTNARITLEQQAAFLRDAFEILPLHPRVDKVFWYNFRCIGTDPDDQQHNFGIVDYDFSPRPAYEALQSLETSKVKRSAPILYEARETSN